MKGESDRVRNTEEAREREGEGEKEGEGSASLPALQLPPTG